jgi:CBS domain-containing protein
MRHNDIGVLPIVDDERHRRLLGIVTDRDLCLAVIAPDRRPSEVRVEECMLRNPVCCSPDDDIRTVVQLIRTHHVRRLPVVNAHGFLVGMMSLTDLIRFHAITDADLETAMECLSLPPQLVPPTD